MATKLESLKRRYLDVIDEMRLMPLDPADRAELLNFLRREAAVVLHGPAPRREGVYADLGYR
jgi:hypothetical protein